MHTTNEQGGFTTGTVESFDTRHGLGAIRPDDGTPPCVVRSVTLHTCGIRSLEAGDRMRFWVRHEGGARTATDLSLLRVVQRWENEGGALGSGPAEV